MILYNEIKKNHLSIFTKTVIDDKTGNIVSQRTVTCPLYVVEKDGFTYFVLYDDQMNVITDAFEYLNYDLCDSPINTRDKTARSIRFLYCYASLAGVNVRKFDQKAIDGLKAFLKGISTNVETYSLKTIRSGSTINGYLAAYRSFFKKRKIPCSELFDGKVVLTLEQNNEFAKEKQVFKYSNNVKTSSKSMNEVPKYISPDDFRKVYSLAVEENDKEAQLIMHLQYGYGLRLGEVLGLTTEDIIERYDNGNYIPTLVLRNRCSDADFQSAKTLGHPKTPDQYKKDSQLRKSKWEIQITYDLYEELLNFINDSHEYYMKKYPKNYEEGVADIVSYRDAPETNHYVFLNRYGRILSDQTWNNRLKYFFKKAGIPLDYGVKEDNLSHRFRHGFAMFHAHYSENKVDVLALQKMMRHKSVSSTMQYYNPTPEDILKMQTEFQEELYKLIPELKEVKNDK